LRSFVISWRNRYLWLIALFAGESSGGFSSSYNGLIPGRGNINRAPDVNGAIQATGDWLHQHIGLIVTSAVLLVVLWIALFILAAICEGATVRASAEHDAERPFGLGLAWRCGLDTMWKIVRLRLLVFALLLPAVVVLFALFAGFLISLVGRSAGAAVAFGGLGALALVAAFVYSVYVGFLDRLGARAVVLEELGAKAALGRGHQLVRRRLGRVLLVWLLGIAIGIALSIAVGIALIVVALPLIFGVIAAVATESGFAVVLIIIGLLILVPAALVVGGFLSAQTSTYWTLAFRRLELEQSPAPDYPLPNPGSAESGALARG